MSSAVLNRKDSSVAIKKVSSKWNSHHFSGNISDTLYSFRVLKMDKSVLIYIGQSDNEVLDELAVALPVQDNVSTTIIGINTGCASQELAQQFTKRLKKQVFISCNIPMSNINRILIVKRIAEEITNVPEAF